jgi:threonine dehydratase
VIPEAAIEAAHKRLQEAVVRTPLLEAGGLGEPEGTDLRLKCESLQHTGSFKARGALHKVLRLSPEEREAGVITVSAGNHAQSLAWAAARAGVSCTVVMPADAPRIKADAVRAHGGTVIPHEDRATLFDRLHREQETRGGCFVHPFDDPVVIAGAGTTGLEIVEDFPEVEWVVVPVGGGGLMAGVASAVKARVPEARIIAVELEDGPGLGPALAAGRPIPVPRPAGTLADGLVPPFVGAIALAVARTAVDRIVTVTEPELLEAMGRLLRVTGLIVEASGAAALAAVLTGKTGIPPGARVAVILSGGNLDPVVLRDRVLGP